MLGLYVVVDDLGGVIVWCKVRYVVGEGQTKLEVR